MLPYTTGKRTPSHFLAHRRLQYLSNLGVFVNQSPPTFGRGWARVPEGITFLELPRSLYDTVYDKPVCQKVQSTVSIQYRRVTDRHRPIAATTQMMSTGYNWTRLCTMRILRAHKFANNVSHRRKLFGIPNIFVSAIPMQPTKPLTRQELSKCWDRWPSRITVKSDDTISWATFELVCGRPWAGILTPALQPGDPRLSDRLGDRELLYTFSITPGR